MEKAGRFVSMVTTLHALVGRLLVSRKVGTKTARGSPILRNTFVIGRGDEQKDHKRATFATRRVVLDETNCLN